MSLATGQGLYVDDPTLLVHCGRHIELGPSHHFAPALPIIEAAFVSVLGATAMALAAPVVLLSWAAVGAAWWTTKDLFGRDAALLVGAAVSLEWTGVLYGSLLAYSESLVLLAVTVTLWAIVRGLRDDRFWLMAGLFAGIGYLSKASIGWFFLIAGLGGLAYRLLYRGWRVLLNRYYWAAIGIFALPFILWSYRNLSLFWDGTLVGLTDAWQTSKLHSQIVADALRQPALLLSGLAGKLPVLAVSLMLPVAPLARPMLASVRRWRDETTFGLWLAVGLIFLLGWFFAAVFWVYDRGNVLWGDHIRYVTPAQVPLLWLILLGGNQPAGRWLVALLILLVMCFVMPVLLLPGFPLAP